jgi:hypothetical protein
MQSQCAEDNILQMYPKGSTVVLDGEEEQKTPESLSDLNARIKATP